MLESFDFLTLMKLIWGIPVNMRFNYRTNIIKLKRLVNVSVLIMIIISGCGPKEIAPQKMDMNKPESVEQKVFKSMTPQKEHLIVAMKNIFSDDKKRISHALSVLEYAEYLHGIEGGDPNVVVAAAVLHDIGIREAERKYGSSAGIYQEIEGPPIARGIM